MRRARETNWRYRLVERRDLVARKRGIVMVDLGENFDPTVDPVLLGITVVPDRKPIRNGYVHFHYPPSPKQYSVELTAVLGKNGNTALRFWIRC